MKKITITKFSSIKEGTPNALKYCHTISFEVSGYKYTLTTTDECMDKLIGIFKEAGCIVDYIVKD